MTVLGDASWFLGILTMLNRPYAFRDDPINFEIVLFESFCNAQQYRVRSYGSVSSHRLPLRIYRTPSLYSGVPPAISNPFGRILEINRRGCIKLTGS